MMEAMYEVDSQEAAVAASALGVGLATIGLDAVLFVAVGLTVAAMVAIRVLRRRRHASR